MGPSNKPEGPFGLYMEKLTLSSDFQKSIIKLMLKEKSFSINCVMHLQADYFENKYLAWSFNKIKDYIDKYKESPTRIYLADQLKAIVPEEQESYKAVLTAIFKSDLKEVSYLKEELTQFIKTSEFKKMHQQEAELFNASRYTEAYQFVTEKIHEINKINFMDDSYVKMPQMDQILLDAPKSLHEYIPTGIPDIDKALNGGMPKGSVTTVLGGWNVGKSIFCINMAYFAAKAGKKVLFIFHEGRVEQVVIRFIARITGIPYNELMAGDYLDDPIKVNKIREAKDLIEKYIRIREMRQVGISIEDVYLYAKKTMEEWHFDILIDDYGQKLTTSKKSFKEMRHVMGHIWNTMDLFSAELNIAVLTMAQLNREHVKLNREGTRIIRSEGISEAAVIAHVSETILTLNKSSHDEADNSLIVCLDKCRDSQAGLLIKCTTNFRNMRAYDAILGFENVGYDTGQKRTHSDEDDEPVEA